MFKPFYQRVGAIKELIIKAFLLTFICLAIFCSCAEDVKDGVELYTNKGITYVSKTGEPYTGKCIDTCIYDVKKEYLGSYYGYKYEKRVVVMEHTYKKGHVIREVHKTKDGKIKYERRYNMKHDQVGELFYDYNGDGNIISWEEYVQKYEYFGVLNN